MSDLRHDAMAIYAQVDDALMLMDRLQIDGLQEALCADLHRQIIALGEDLRVVVDALRDSIASTDLS